MIGMTTKYMILGALVVSLQAAPVHAETLSDLLPDFISNNNQYKAAKADMDAAEESIRTAMGDYFPTLDTTATYGYERQLKPSASDTSLPSRELDFILTQNIWDFGTTDATINTARLQHQQSAYVLNSTRSSLLLRAFTAYVNVIRAARVLEFAIRSEENIKKQTELEDAMVGAGAGFTTDILQAKVQLAGAMARRVRAEGALEIAKNTYHGVFLSETGPVDGMVHPVLPMHRMPASREEAVSRALENSALLEASNIGSLIARETVKQTFSSSYRPTIDGIIDYKLKEDVGGTVGTQDEMFLKVQVNFPFNLGMTAQNTVKATELAESASNYRHADARTQVEERTRNSWQQLLTARDNAMLLNNQANIAEQFLELAREERNLGNRSLLDVLNGETALINARSDAASAETDVAIAMVTLLDTMGDLDESDFQ